MSNFSMRRWLIGAGVLSLAALVFTAGFGTAGDEPPNEPEEPMAIAQPSEAPLDHPVANYLPKGWQDLQESVVVEFSAITKDGNQLVADVRMTNRGEATLKGPVRVVIDDMGLEGASLKNASGKLDNAAQYVEILTKAKTLKAGKTTAPRKLTIVAQAEPAAEKLAEFAPQYRVLVPADPAKPEDRDTATEFTQEQLNQAMASQNALDAEIRKAGNKDVFGTSTAIDEQGQLYIAVYARIANPTGVPATKDGLPVKVELEGPFFPQYEDADAELYDNINTDARFSRPVPTGVGIGNEKGCSGTGTLGARVVHNGQRCLLSNYHVLVQGSGPVVAHKIYQPGGCQFATDANAIGRLYRYMPITFSTSASNRYDAAWATTTSALTKTRPPAGYSTLGSPRAPALGLRVHKFGRTTRYTRGRITAVNVTFNVNYSRGAARFVGCFKVQPEAGFSQFSAPGDSGSLVITQGTNQPVGLHFAGSGGIGYSCPVAQLLSSQGMRIE